MVFDIILVLVLLICFITDLRVQKIYNKVIFPALLAALLLHFTLNGFAGLKLSLIGFVVGLSILLIPYFLGGFGAGDVKLLALIGATKGTPFVINTAIYMGLIGGAVALVIIVLHKGTINFFKSIYWWVASLFGGSYYKFELPTSALIKKYPYGVAIVGGALICLIFKEAWII
jgi:prepilin peptidase CpaA